MQTLIERGCGLDVHQATVVACLLLELQLVAMLPMAYSTSALHSGSPPSEW